MLTNRLNRAVLLFVACTPLALGCSRTNTTHVAPLANASHAVHDHGDHAHGADPEIAKALASLSASDRAAAENQKVCPVTDEPLGSMGAPMKVSVQGRDVFICCEGCKEPLTDDPGTFLAKLTK